MAATNSPLQLSNEVAIVLDTDIRTESGWQDYSAPDGTEFQGNLTNRERFTAVEVVTPLYDP